MSKRLFPLAGWRCSAGPFSISVWCVVRKPPGALCPRRALSLRTTERPLQPNWDAAHRTTMWGVVTLGQFRPTWRNRSSIYIWGRYPRVFVLRAVFRTRASSETMGQLCGPASEWTTGREIPALRIRRLSGPSILLLRPVPRPVRVCEVSGPLLGGLFRRVLKYPVPFVQW